MPYSLMRESYPHIDLVQFLYREMPAAEAAEMAQRLDVDAALRSEYDELVEAKSQLPKDRFNPSPAAIRNILAYSARATAVEPQL
jgi:hypothetical protein